MNTDELYKIIKLRMLKKPKDSYVAFLLKKGKDKILQKIGEESTEVIIATKNKKKKEIIHEVADLYFHLIVMLAFLDIDPRDIFNELEKRKNKIPV